MLKGWGREGCTSRSGSLPTNVLLQQRASCKRRRKTMRAQLNPNCRQPTPPQPHSFHQQAGQTSSRLWSKSKLLHPYYNNKFKCFSSPFFGKIIFNILDISLLIKLGRKICTSFCLDISSSSFPITFFFTSTWIVDTVILKWCDALGDIRAQQLGLPESGIGTQEGGDHPLPPIFPSTVQEIHKIVKNPGYLCGLWLETFLPRADPHL